MLLRLPAIATMVLLTAVLAGDHAIPGRAEEGDEVAVLLSSDVVLPLAEVPPASQPAALPRATQDRPDQTSGYQIHFIYLVPSGGNDHAYDIDAGRIPRSIAAQNWWLQSKTGRSWRVDTYNGEPDITFVASTKTAEQLNYFDAIRSELITLGFDDNRKRYVVYVESTVAAIGICGVARTDSFYAVVFLKDTANGCNDSYWADSPTQPRWLENTALQETIHTEAIVDTDAPNECQNPPHPVTSNWHVCDDPPVNDVGGDVMHWHAHDMPSNLDLNSQDYWYLPPDSPIRDLRESSYLSPSLPRGAIDVPQPGPPGQPPVVGKPFTVSGWALDEAQTALTNVFEEIDRVEVFAYPSDANGNYTVPGVSLGLATLGQPSPAIGALYGMVFDDAGWTKSASLPTGQYYHVKAWASSIISGQWFELPGGVTFALESDNDGIFDPADNCPAWTNPQQNLPPWTVPAGDPDCDGFTSTAEASITTNPNDACGFAPGGAPQSETWPPDLVETNSINVSDALALKPVFGSSSPPARMDIVLSGSINISDVLAVKPFSGKSCTP